MKELIQGRDVNHSCSYLSFYFKPDGDAETRKPVKIIGRPVEGVDDPLPCGSLPLKRTFLCQDIMFRKSIGNHFYNSPLAESVHFRHRVELSFVLNRMRMVRVEYLNPARFISSGDG